jgi:tight adherence protein B
VLGGLARLARSDDRTRTREVAGGVAGLGGAERAGLGVGAGGSHVRRRGSSAESANTPTEPVFDRLRSGWLLTRRHGLAFTPLIEALAADVAEQLAADSERSGQVAGPRTSGYVMALLPLMGLALGAGMGADPVHVLLGSPLGNVLLLVGVTLTCAGLLWSARIVRR